MIQQPPHRHTFFTCVLGLCLGLTLQAEAQQTRSGGTGGGFGGGGFGGGGFGGGSRSSTSSSSSTGSTARQYPNNTTIGDAYFSIDPETHRLVYIADEATAKYISQVLTNLDRPKPQVLIKVAFIEVSRSTGLDLGVDASFRGTTGSSPSTSIVTNYTSSSTTTTSGTNTTVNSIATSVIAPLTSMLPTSFLTGSNVTGGNVLPGLSSVSGVGGLYQILGQDYQVTLHAIATAGKAKILSRPSIIARNNQPATILVGQEVPLITGVNYDSLGNQHNSITYTDVGVILKVTPFITEDGLVQMLLSPQISELDPTLSVPISYTSTGTPINAPIIDIRSADTVVVTPDGQTVVIGGLIQNTKSEAESKVPFLGDIPILGNLFKRKVTSEDKSELLIFLTPHVIQIPSQLAALTSTERARSDAVKSLNEKELDRFLDTIPPKKDSKKSSKTKPLAPAPSSN
jgi:general secretion pathway protein D